MEGFAIFGGFVGFIFAIFMLVMIIKLDVEMADIAEMKGYDRKSAFVYCFFFSILGFIYVLALPNKNEKQVVIKETNKTIDTDELPEI